MLGPLTLLLLSHFSCSLCSTEKRNVGHQLFSGGLSISRPRFQDVRLTFVFCLPGALEVPPLGADEAAQLAEGEVWVLGFDDCSHLTAEQDVAAHVDLPLRALLLGKALYGFRRGLETKCSRFHKNPTSHTDNLLVWRGDSRSTLTCGGV